MVGSSAVIDGPAIVCICLTPPPPSSASPSSNRCINLHAIFEKEASKKKNKQWNGSVLKNDSQYPLAIEVRNFPLLNAGGKIDTESGREKGREGGQAGDVPALLSILTFIAARLYGNCERVRVCLEKRSCFE